MRLNNDQIAGFTLLITTIISLLFLNIYFYEIDIYGWYSLGLFGAAIVGCLISLAFFAIANRHFKKIKVHIKNRWTGWFSMAAFFAINIASNFIGLSELARIKNW